MSAFSAAYSPAYGGGVPDDSRAYLEPAMAASVPGDLPTAEAIRAELETRVWQWHNPYAGWSFTP